MMSNIGCLLGGFNWISNVFFRLNRRYRKICDEPGRKETTMWFGVYSIIMSIFTTGMFVLCAWAIMAILDLGDLGIIVFIVFIIGFVVALVVLLVEYICSALMGIFYQFRCNRRPIGFIALAVFILTTAAMIIGILFVAGVLGI
ncbi:MAG: hypothetical protein HDT28_09585 [Clostridiales bacterium]|nr:hypothetical protein [Clostridiales bacterium]